MVRREVLDDFLRQRAKTNGATLINGLFLGMTLPEKKGDSYVLTYNDYAGEEGNARKGEKKTLEVDVVIGADGANSRVAKDIEAGDYESLGCTFITCPMSTTSLSLSLYKYVTIYISLSLSLSRSLSLYIYIYVCVHNIHCK